MLDAIVIGGGPAGLAATTWLGRHRRRTLLVDAGEPRNRFTETLHGYLGWDATEPATLLAAARKQIAGYEGVDIASGRAVSARGSLEDGFAIGIEDTDGNVTSHPARRILLATGVGDALPDIEGFFAHYGRSAFHCPSCDGYEARGLPVVAIGWSAHVAGFALGLLDWASAVTVVTNGVAYEGDDQHREALAAAGIDLVEEEVRALVGEPGDLRGVELTDGRQVPGALAFFSIAHRPHDDLAIQLGCDVDEHGHVVVNGAGMTSVPGVYAAGDLTPGLQLVQAAAGKGAVAGVACAMSLRRFALAH